MSSAPRSGVRHAVIPCHRSDGVEVLPIAGMPIIEWVARECAASGTSDLLVLTGPGAGGAAIQEKLAPHMGSPGFPLRIAFTAFPSSPTLGDAIHHGHTFANEGPFGVAVPTNLFIGDAAGLSQIIEGYYRSGRNIVGVVGTTNGDEVALDARLDHTVGRYLFTEEPDGEDATEVLRHLLEESRLIGWRMRGQFFDVGTTDGYEQAKRVTIRPPRPSLPTGRIDG